MNLKFGFDELYVIVINNSYFESECLYDIETAKDKALYINKNFGDVKIVSLETALYNGYSIKK